MTRKNTSTVPHFPVAATGWRVTGRLPVSGLAQAGEKSRSRVTITAQASAGILAVVPFIGFGPAPAGRPFPGAWP